MRKRPRRSRASDRPPSARPSDQLHTLLERRILELSGWMRHHAPYCVREQAHLDEHTRERAYWHYGYLAGLRDVRSVLRASRRQPPRES